MEQELIKALEAFGEVHVLEYDNCIVYSVESEKYSIVARKWITKS